MPIKSRELQKTAWVALWCVLGTAGMLGGAEPVAKQPPAKQLPAVEKPTVEKPTVEKPAAKKPIAKEAAAERPYGIDKRILWTTSRVVGSPEPPLPYRAVKTLEQLKVTQPIYLINEPGSSRMWLIEYEGHWMGPGRISRFDYSADVDHAETVLERDRLIYGLTFHPNFATNGYVFVMSNGPWKEKEHKFNRISRFTVDERPPYKLLADSELVVLEWESNGHNGGDLAFGPDGYLYVPTGDGTSDSDTNLTGQTMNDLLAAMLRLDVDHPSGGKAYSVPADNPFVAMPGARPEVWAYGFRNPWRMAFNRQNGQLWVGNNGQDLWEQVFLVRRGDNYGWSVYEGGHPFQLERKLGPTPHVPPAAEHPHSEARSLTGGVVYDGDRFPELKGVYIYGDFSTGRIWGIRHDGQRVTYHRELADTTLQITGFAVAPDGNLLVLDHLGGIYRFEPSPPVEKHAPFPTRLSETGLFVSTAENRPDPALIPYSVNAALWSDGALKERWIALPGESQIEFTERGGWNLPEGAVLVKTFSLELAVGQSASQRRIETRLLTRQQSEWQGYSYIWNDEQTDATLVAQAGLDRTFKIQDPAAPAGRREQTWHYPSRAECMVCHSRAANYVLGPSLLQMNKEHDYGGVRDNQLRTLDHLGIFSGKPKKKQKSDSDAKGVLPKPPEEYPRLVDPYDSKLDLEARARSYLHANCSICHVNAGGGNSRVELAFHLDRDKMHLIGAPAQHQTFGMSDARLVAPGHPDRSMLYQRINRRGPGQMPPLATSLVDRQVVELVRAWIEQLPAEKTAPPAP